MQTIDMGSAKIEEQPLRCVLYGEAGAGKTHLMREFPKPMLVYDFDGKYEPLVGVEGITVKSFRAEDRTQCAKVWTEFWDEWKKDKKDSQWATYVVDSLTSLDMLMFFTQVTKSGLNPMNKKSYDKFTRGLWGDVKDTYSMLFNSMRSSGKHVIILAHELFREDDEGKLLSVTPLVSGSMKNIITALFKDTWYLERKGTAPNEKRFLHYKKFKYRVCTSVMMNDSSGVIEKPTYDKIVAAYRKEKSK